jgi:hypothetical protein
VVLSNTNSREMATGGSSTESKEMRKRRLLDELRKKSKRNVNEDQAQKAHQSSTCAGKTKKYN